jgi:hypothetical protein
VRPTRSERLFEATRHNCRTFWAPDRALCIRERDILSLVVWIIGSAVVAVTAFLVCWALGNPKAIWIVPATVAVLALRTHWTELDVLAVLGIAIYVAPSLAGGWLAIGARRRQARAVARSHASN